IILHRPPISSLFPYTTLFRSLMLNLHTPEVPNDRLIKVLEEEANVKLDIDWVPDNNYEERLNTAFSTNSLPQVILVKTDQFIQRSEEHTSELQSRFDLVCRLL